jgi:phage tail-like protein
VPSTGARLDPFLGFRFDVRFVGLEPAGFSECGGLQAETEVLAYPEGGRNTTLRQFPTRTKYPNLVLRRGLVDRAFWDWYGDVIAGTITRRSGQVTLRDPAGDEAVATWELLEAFPCKWIGPPLNASQSTIAVETFELCHEGLSRNQ